MTCNERHALSIQSTPVIFPWLKVMLSWTALHLKGVSTLLFSTYTQDRIKTVQSSATP